MTEETQHLVVGNAHLNYKTNLNNERESTKFFCSQCQKVQDSDVEFKVGTWTLICCGIWCILTFFGGLVPFCCKPCKDAIQYCPECHNKVGEAQFAPC